VGSRRIFVFVLALLVVASLASAIAPSERARRPTTAPPPPTSVEPAPSVEATLPGSTVRAAVGDVVTLRVAHDGRDVVQIADLGVSEPVEDGIVAELVFDADREGRFAVTLLESGERLGEIVVRAAR